MLEQYFGNKVGQTIGRQVTTGNKDFTATYARVYRAEILEVSRTMRAASVAVHVTSYDVCPSGAREMGSEHVWGDRIISLIDVGGLEDFWRRVIELIDPMFLRWLKVDVPATG